MISRAHLLAACLCVSASVWASSPVLAQNNNGDPFQRYFVFFNEFTDRPIFPIIQGPVEANCGPKGDTSLLRIFVNDRQRGVGIPPGGSVTVAIPKNQPCDLGGFYNAARIFVLLANAEQFEAVIQPSQRTTDLQVPWAKDICPNANDQQPACWVGRASGPYIGDMPGQLLEYTIISQVRGAPSPNGPNDPNGVPFIDYDVSYVDDAYLPVAMAIGGGVVPYMGSSLDPQTFNQRLTSFLQDPTTQWSAFAAFSERNWPNTVFQHLVPRTDKLPSGDIVVSATRTGGTSSYYTASANPDDPKECKAPPPRNLQCSAPLDQGGSNLQTGDCCPNENGVILGCCDALAFLVDGTLKTFTPNISPPLRLTTYDNKTLDAIVQRWRFWREKGPDCQSQPPLGPVVPAQQAEFCTAFESTFNFIWRDFASRGSCSQRRDAASDECIVSSIIGYTVPDSDKTKCLQCPTVCPAECLLDTQRNESVQALLRSVPWTPSGDPAACTACPGINCPKDCIFPPNNQPSPNAKLYHRDGFLHFWAPYDNPYNLNPFARFVHNSQIGLAALGAYAFSIDDFYGNFAGPGSTLVIDVGGTANLPNKDPFNPYEQYFASWGHGWNQATVCGREVRIPDKTVGQSFPISFWTDGVKAQPPVCQVTLYADTNKTKFVQFHIEECSYSVTDAYSGQQHTVRGLCGKEFGPIFAARPGNNTPTPNDRYCSTPALSHSAQALIDAGACFANLAPAGGTLLYAGVTECDDPLNDTCGRPLMTINIPPCPTGQCDP